MIEPNARSAMATLQWGILFGTLTSVVGLIFGASILWTTGQVSIPSAKDGETFDRLGGFRLIGQMIVNCGNGRTVVGLAA